FEVKTLQFDSTNAQETFVNAHHIFERQNARDKFQQQQNRSFEKQQQSNNEFNVEYRRQSSHDDNEKKYNARYLAHINNRN
ncbi:hypothetical protein FQN54_005800, partial [Arachnomyces sp. PD_36]